jgi:tetratricopeptide (TPR) repeat protein
MSDVTNPGDRLRPRQQAALLVAATMAVFASTLSSDFVYDARLQVLTDPFLHEPRNWWPVLTFQTLGMDVLDFNRPVNLASLMLDATLWGKEPFGYHLSSVLLHAANVVLVWLVVRRLGGPGGAAPALPALLGSLFFAVHPLVTEAVCEPTFREDLLVAGCTLAALLIAMGHDASASGWDPRRVAAVAGFCLLAIGSKESGVAAPLLVAAYWLLFRRGEPGRFWPLASGAAVAVVAAFLAARFLLEVSSSRIFEYRPEYPGGTLANALAILPRILALYAQLVVLPVNQCADYGLYSVRHLPPPAAIGVVVVTAAALVWGAWRDRRIALAAAVIVLPLVPVMNLVPIYRAAADRYLYLSLAGVGMTVAFFLDAPWIAGRPRLRSAATVATAAAVAALALACMARQRVWSGQLALWEDTFRKNPVAFTAASGLAESLRDASRLAEAEQAARRAIELCDGSRGEPWATLALILDDQGRTAEADAAVEKALEAEPKLADPDGRVAVMAMEQPYADAFKRLLARRPRR